MVIHLDEDDDDCGGGVTLLHGVRAEIQSFDYYYYSDVASSFSAVAVASPAEWSALGWLRQRP